MNVIETKTVEMVELDGRTFMEINGQSAELSDYSLTASKGHNVVLDVTTVSGGKARIESDGHDFYCRLDDNEHDFLLSFSTERRERTAAEDAETVKLTVNHLVGGQPFKPEATEARPT